jgi:DHA1 family bicyclomycin/chloramphenicol resistance-like MFS transporter
VNKSTTINVQSSKQLGSSTMMVFITLLSAFAMMATDLYLPAVPTMKDQLNTTVELVNLTLVLFFMCMSISSLIMGPLSDRLGRKPVLMACIVIYIIASLACALSPNIYFLIVARAFQAIGCGAGMTISASIVKDFFPPEKKEKAFAIMGAMSGSIPIIAPVVGAQILRFTTWRGEFVVLMIMGLITLVFGIMFKETHFDRSSESVPVSILRLFVVLRNPSFTRLVNLFSIAPLGMMAFIGISNFIFIERFGVSEQAFSFFFAGNAVISVCGSLAYIPLSRLINPMTIISECFVFTIVSGLLVTTIGRLSPYLFILSVAIGTLSFTMVRPPSMNLMLEQQDEDTGSASSLISFFMTILGSFSLWFISKNWSDRVLVLGLMYTIIGIFTTIFWLYAKRRCRIPKNFMTG